MPSTLLIERDRAIRMRDDVVLRADVWRAAGGPPSPVLLQRTPYDKGDLHVAAHHAGLDPLRAVAAGWVIVIADVRGRHASGGTFTPFASEAADGADTVAWMRAQPWCDGRVCTYGTSYCGLTSLAAAVGEPDGLTAVAAVETATPERWTAAGGAVLESFVTTWAQADLAPAEAARRAAAGRPPEALDALVPELAGWLRGAGVPERLAWERTRVPALLVAGWNDLFLEAQLDAWAARPGQQLVVGPWAHGLTGSRVGSVDFGPAAAQAALDLTAVQLDFFAAALAGHVAGIPRVRLFVMGAGVWIAEDAWPPPRTRPLRLHLRSGGRAASSGGELLPEAPGDGEPADAFAHDPADPVATAGGPVVVASSYGVPGPADQSGAAARPDVLTYTSRPLVGAVELIGTIRAHLAVASTAATTDWTVKVVDVHPDGRPLSVTDGILRSRVADGRVEVRVGSTALRLAPGHRLRVEIAGSNHPRFAVQPQAARQRIFHDAERPSWIELPVASGTLA